MIAIADINTIWRRKPFEALAETTPVLGLSPRDVFVALRHPKRVRRLVAEKYFNECPVTMPPGWASRFPGWTARRLWSVANRAVRGYGVPSDHVSVSSNATEEAFLKAVSEHEIQVLLNKFPKLRRPLVGVVGGINDRLDGELLLAVAERPEVGTLVMVGPEASDLHGPAWTHLHSHPHCLFVGAQLHAELPVWMQALDVALIPYRDTPLNRSCSPMRLFDHLAAGRPIVATGHCCQVREFDSLVEVAPSNKAFLEMLAWRIAQGDSQDMARVRREAASANLWTNRAEKIATCLERYTV